MSEFTKTIIFIVGGVAAVGAAWISSSSAKVDLPDQVGQPLFADFQDPYTAKSMGIIEVDDELADPSTFEVAQKQGMWVIPSHSDYPADAQDNLKEAATMLIDLDVVAVASDSLSDHELYGVVEPDPDATTLGDKGVGKLIEFKGETDDRLASLVIGKAVEGREGQRFVRVPGQDRVYVVKIDPAKISTDFKDWIESDLLKLNSFDIEEMTIRDYSVTEARTRTGAMAIIPEERLTMRVRWNAQDFNWQLEEFKEYAGKELVESQLLENEELNKTSLDGMKSALDELEIVDVERKPAGLKADLTASAEFGKDNESLQSLADAGFYPVPNEDDSLRLMSSDGEVLINTKDNIIYTLRFGRVAGIEAESGSDTKLNRFVMVTVAAKSIPEPELEALPGTEKDSPPSDNAETENESSDDDGSESADAAPPGNAKAADDEPAEDANAERDRIMKENQRKLDEHKDKLQKTNDKVAELNGRFAPWYYVVSEDVYKKIHLGRPDIIKEKEGTAKEGTGIESFRALESDGLKRDEK